MIHISDLSWTKRYNHPSEFTKVDEEIEVVIISIDKENRKLSLGHKQLEDDPWNTFETIFPIHSIHEGTVTRVEDKGAIVQLEYGLEAFAPTRHLKKEEDRKSTRLNSSHVAISYAVFCLKKKNKTNKPKTVTRRKNHHTYSQTQ